MRILTTMLLLVAAAAVAPAQNPGGAKPKKGAPATGIVDLAFTERSPLSTLAAQAERLGWTTDPAREGAGADEYALEKEAFKAYVPKAYDGKKAFGLLVWIHPGDEAWIHPEWAPVLDRANVIMVEALKSGNERLVPCRAGLALDAAHNLAKRYRIDPERTWVGGFSGGGRVASMMGFHYPDVFRGTYAMGGANHWVRLASTKDPSKGWSAAMPAPNEERLGLAKSKRRFVLSAGSEDFNHEQSKAIAESLAGPEGFQHVLFQEQPGKGHEPPDGATFERGLRFLDGKPEPATPPKPEKRPSDPRRGK